MFSLIKSLITTTINTAHKSVGVVDDVVCTIEAGSASLKAHAQHLRASDEVSMLEERAVLMSNIRALADTHRVTIGELYEELGISR